ncbi:hypothetical protein CapIbe_022795 [Capra ibex]
MSISEDLEAKKYLAPGHPHRLESSSHWIITTNLSSLRTQSEGCVLHFQSLAEGLAPSQFSINIERRKTVLRSRSPVSARFLPSREETWIDICMTSSSIVKIKWLMERTAAGIKINQRNRCLEQSPGIFRRTRLLLLLSHFSLDLLMDRCLPPAVWMGCQQGPPSQSFSWAGPLCGKQCLVKPAGVVVAIRGIFRRFQLMQDHISVIMEAFSDSLGKGQVYLLNTPRYRLHDRGIG